MASPEARKVLQDAIVIDTLGGAVVHPTPYVPPGQTYEGNMVGWGWNILHACLVSEPSYSPTFPKILNAVYENLLNFEMSPGVRHVETVEEESPVRDVGDRIVLRVVEQLLVLDPSFADVTDVADVSADGRVVDEVRQSHLGPTRRTVDPAQRYVGGDDRHDLSLPVAEGEAILDAALRAGMDLPFACKGGMCSTCRANLIEGEAEMEVNYSLEPWELEAGFILTCQARPTSAKVVVDYDHV